ncbi:MAG: flagellar biosynthesis protein FlhF, partial [Burkholderiales bacterium]
MNVMRFVGRTSREAMRKLRDALGPDALVLANRPCAEGVELLAAAPGALQGLSASPGEPAVEAARTVAAGGAAHVAEEAAAVPAGMSTV